MNIPNTSCINALLDIFCHLDTGSSSHPSLFSHAGHLKAHEFGSLLVSASVKRGNSQSSLPFGVVGQIISPKRDDKLPSNCVSQIPSSPPIFGILAPSQRINKSTSSPTAGFFSACAKDTPFASAPFDIFILMFPPCGELLRIGIECGFAGCCKV